MILWGVTTLDDRLDGVEQRLVYRPPEAPNDEEDEGADDLAPDEVEGHTIYAPVYSHVYQGKGRPILLSALVSVRNVSRRPVTISSADYYDTAGRRVRRLLQRPRELKRLETIEFLIPTSDVEGGSGANVLVHWDGPEGAHPPLVEVVMQGSAGTHGVSFVRPGIPVQLAPDPPAAASPGPAAAVGEPTAAPE